MQFRIRNHNLIYVCSFLASIHTSLSFVPLQFQKKNAIKSPYDQRRNGKLLSLMNNDDANNRSFPAQIEQEVIASANAKVDVNRLKNALSEKSKSGTTDEFNIGGNKSIQSSQWNVALASGGMTGIVSFLIFHQLFLSVCLFLGATYVASKDPIYEDDGILAGDEISGPVARIIGRLTIKSIEESKPKVKAVARAAIFGDDEIESLRQRLQDLEIENEDMRIWISRRCAIDNFGKFYSLQNLRLMARQNGIAMEGNKTELMMKLMDAGVLKLDGVTEDTTWY